MSRRVFLLILAGISVISSAHDSVGNRVAGAVASDGKKLEKGEPRSRVKGEFQSPEGDVHKVVRITRQDVNEATQLLKGRDATDEEVRRSKDFMRKNSLPSSFEERKQLVEKLIETTYQEDKVSREDRRKVMGLLYRKEREAQEQRAAKGIADRDKDKSDSDTKETGNTFGEETKNALGKNDAAVGIPSTFLNDASANAADFSEIAKALPGPSADTAPEPASPGSPAQAAQAAGPTDEEVFVPRAGHSGGSVASVPLAFPDPIVVLPSGPAVSSEAKTPPPVTRFNPEALKANLTKVLEERVRTGEISPTEGKQAMKDIISQFDGERGSGEPKLPRTGLNDVPKTTPDAIADKAGEGETDPSKKNESISEPNGITVFGSSGSGSPAIPVAGENASLVANEMSKILTDFGKLSLEPDGGKGKKPGDAPGAKAGGMVGVMSASGGGSVAPSDNSGLTPSIVSKSGGTLVLAGKGTADESTADGATASKEPSKGWLNDLISRYISHKRGKPGRMPASPTKAGLPGGSLSPREQAEVSFIPEVGSAIAEASLGDTEAPDRAEWFLWLGGAALSLSTFWALRRRNEEATSEDDSDRQAS